VIVLGRVVDFEHDCNLRIKIFNVEFGEIVFRVKNQPVGPTRQRFSNQKERFHPAILVGPGVTQLGPRFISVLDVQMNRDATGGRTARNVEYVR